jgi:hypothetical protein
MYTVLSEGCTPLPSLQRVRLAQARPVVAEPGLKSLISRDVQTKLTYSGEMVFRR